MTSGSNQNIAYASISVGILVALVLFIGLLKHFLVWKKRFSPPPEFKYHAFIIYSQEDSHWVNGKLLPFLEERHYLKCCIHYRDFTPGKPFTESMAESVYNSYKIIAVFSSNFLKSNYCCYELNIAKYRLLNKRDDSLIIVRIDIDSECRQLPRELRKRSFIDYSNCFERPLWESKLLRFLNVQDDSSNQHATEKQTDYNNTNQVIMCVL
ncbi:toll-like receptor 2 [Oculina patagonica]